MKRLHVHVAVKDLAESTRFYATLFGAQPSVVKPDYAKWMLDDPRVNFAISTRASERTGLDHLGLQVDTREELASVAGQLSAAGEPLREQTATTCCYARSDKAWSKDPSGIAWETFYTFGEATEYGEDMIETPGLAGGAAACCAPAAAGAKASAQACC